MTVYRVEVEERRYATVFVDAPDPAEAEKAALELYDDFIHDDEHDVDVKPLPEDFEAPEGFEVWVEPDGNDAGEGDFVDLKAHLEGQ